MHLSLYSVPLGITAKLIHCFKRKYYYYYSDKLGNGYFSFRWTQMTNIINSRNMRLENAEEISLKVLPAINHHYMCTSNKEKCDYSTRRFKWDLQEMRKSTADSVANTGSDNWQTLAWLWKSNMLRGGGNNAAQLKV